MIKVLMICHGNICRSPMAEFVLKHLVLSAHKADQYYIESAATSQEELGSDVHRGTKNILTTMKIPFEKRRARQLTKADYDKFDYLICMDSRNITNALRIIGDDPQKKLCKLLDFTEQKGDIADPWYTGDFELTYKEVLLGCEEFLKKN